jgi:predicted DNA-binding protein
MDFKSLSKLSEAEYCNKLVVLTSDIIEKYFNDMEITYLAERIQNGEVVNKLSKEKVIYINKDNLEGLDISNDKQKSIKKKRVCIGIAKFYVKVAHIFAAIVMTINPVYTYKDANGQTVKTGLLKKDKIPKNVDRKLFKLNICDNRIRALKKNEVEDEITGNVSLQPKVCDMNTNKDGIIKSLSDEPGITELMDLYLDDTYDYSNGTFTGMSENTRKQFNRDLEKFYIAFTGNSSMPPEITKFSDIKLKDYGKEKSCSGLNPTFRNKYTINKKDKLFIDYAENTKKMIQNAADNQSKLLSVINKLFTYIIDPYSGKKVIRLNPVLTDKTLQEEIEKTRKLIVDLYVKCETDYVNGIKLYEAIVESKILETTEKQIENLKAQASKTIQDTKKATDSIKEPVFIKPEPVSILGPSNDDFSKKMQLGQNINDAAPLSIKPVIPPMPKPLAASIPNPAASMPNPDAPPDTPMPNPAVSIPNPAAPMPNPAVSIPNPIASIPNPAVSIPNPAASIPNPIASIPNPAASIPNPAASIPNPAASIPNPAAPPVSDASLNFQGKIY